MESTSRAVVSTTKDLYEEDWAQRINYLIPVPVHYRRPEIKFSLQSEHVSSNENKYNVECDIIENKVKPLISEIGSYTLNTPTPHTIDFNSRISLNKEYGFFPAQYDSRSTGATAASLDAAKVRYTVKIQYHDFSQVEWQGVDVEFSYGDETFTKYYAFEAQYSHSAIERNRTFYVTLDTADLEGKFNWQNGEKLIYLKMTPVGKIITDYDFRGTAKKFIFTALFDLQTVKESYPMLCSSGFYPSTLSTFVRDDLLSLMIDGESSGAALRCGDASTPFGGPFELSTTWKYRNQRYGQAINTKSINDPAEQDTYDDFTSATPVRLGDVEEYMNFSDAAKAISLLPEFDTENNPTARKNLYDFCHPQVGTILAPCEEETTFNDIDHDMILKICQWNMIQGQFPAVCPSTNGNRVVRFSSWVEKNSTAFVEWSRRQPLKGNISAGAGRSSVLLRDTEWQREALVRGAWPDGKPIWKTSDDKSTLVSSKILSCHADLEGCFLINSLFSTDDKFFNNLSIQTGWK